MSRLRDRSRLAGGDAGSYRFALVVSDTHEEVCDRLLRGARQALSGLGVPDANVGVFRVPGSWELPMAASRLADAGAWDAVVCLGTLIRGETFHFEVLARSVADAVQGVAARSGLPVTFGVLTCDDREQALARSGGDRGNKGREAAVAAAEMAVLYADLDGES